MRTCTFKSTVRAGFPKTRRRHHSPLLRLHPFMESAFIIHQTPLPPNLGQKLYLKSLGLYGYAGGRGVYALYISPAGEISMLRPGSWYRRNGVGTRGVLEVAAPPSPHWKTILLPNTQGSSISIGPIAVESAEKFDVTFAWRASCNVWAVLGRYEKTFIAPHE